MPKPETVERRRASDSLEGRVEDLERRVGTLEGEVKLNTLELRANTELTRQVHTMAEKTEKNTEDVVKAVQWLSTSKAVIVAVGSMAGATLAVVALGKALGWW